MLYCEQFVEKALKHIINININCEPSDIALIQSHKVVQLAKRVEQILNIHYSREDYNMFRRLQGYYFDLNYPGDRYEDIDKEETDDVIQWLKNFKIVIEQQLSSICILK